MRARQGCKDLRGVHGFRAHAFGVPRNDHGARS
jgi:hypothetical protein